MFKNPKSYFTTCAVSALRSITAVKAVAAVSAVMLLTTGFGCKGFSAAQQAAIKPVTLEYWTVFDDVDALNKQIAAFRVDRPYITINLKQLRYEEFYPRLVEALAEDKGPDIISIRNRSVGIYLSKLAPLPASVTDSIIQVTKSTLGTNTQVITASHPTPTIDQIESDFVQTVKKDVVKGGKVYGLPLSLDTMAIYYNKDILDKSGVPTPPKNWEEFQAAVKKITRYDKQTGKILQSGVALGAGNNVIGLDDILYILFKQSGVDLTSKNGQATFNLNNNNGDNPAEAVMNFYTDFANPARDTYSWNESMGNSLDAFVNGQVGFFLGYSYHLPIIKTRAPQLNLGIMPMLQLDPDNHVNVANYWVQGVVGKSKHQNEAWNLLVFLTHSEATKNYLTTTGRPTALRAYIAEQQKNIELAPFVQDLLVADNWYRGNNYDAAVSALQAMIKEWSSVPAGTDRVDIYLQNVLDRAASKINQTL